VVVDGGPVLRPTTSELTAAADGTRLAIHGDLAFAGTEIPTDPVALRVSHFNCVGRPAD
jgi:hypothetical protein